MFTFFPTCFCIAHSGGKRRQRNGPLLKQKLPTVCNILHNNNRIGLKPVTHPTPYSVISSLTITKIASAYYLTLALVPAASSLLYSATTFPFPEQVHRLWAEDISSPLLQFQDLLVLL